MGLSSRTVTVPEIVLREVEQAWLLSRQQYRQTSRNAPTAAEVAVRRQARVDAAVAAMSAAAWPHEHDQDGAA